MKIRDIITENQQDVREGVLTDIRYAWVRILTGLADKVISLANSGELNTKQRDAIAHGTKELEQKLLAKISGHPREQQLRPYVDYIVKQVGQQTNFSDFSKTLYQMAKQFKPELGKFSEGVAEGRLNELAPGGSEGNGPFEYGTAIIQIGEDFVDTYSDEGAGADAAAIIKVGRKFMSAGMKAGIRAFYAMDTQLRDHVAEELEDQGFNVRKDIYEPHDKSLPATTWTRPVTDADRDWYLLQDLIKEFSKARQGSVDPKTLEQLRQDFGWSLQMGFLELPKKSIRADFTDFAKSKGVDLTAMAKKYEVRRPAAEGKITRTATGLIHRGTKGYGADYEPDYGTDVALSQQKHHADLNRVNKPKLRSLEKSMGIDFKNDTQDVEGDIGPSEQEMNQSISDLVKDALGTRPNGQWMQRWQDSTEKQKRDLYNRLVKQLEQE